MIYTHLNCIVIDADATNRNELANFLTQYGANVVGQFGTIDALPAQLSRPDPPQLVLINLDPGAQESLKKISHLPRQYPLISFFLLSQVLDANLLMEAMHLGVKEFIPLPMSVDKFTAALDRAAQAYGAAKRAKVIHVIPTVGGCGSTTVSCNIAAALAKNGKTALIDLDLMRGGVAASFDLRPRFTIADVMDSADKVDKQLLDNALIMHKASDLAVLARPELPEDTMRINQPGLSRLLGIVSRMFDYVVVDSMMSIAPLYTTVVRAADVNVVVMQLNIPSAKNAERFVGTLRRMGIETNKIKVIVNRYEKKHRDIDPDEVERALGLKISWLVPNDFKNAIAALNFGEPAFLRTPKAYMSVSLRDLAAMLGTREGEVAENRNAA
jgi:pilus assembly protein CpaE